MPRFVNPLGSVVVVSDADAAAIASAGWELVPEADAGKTTGVKKSPVKAKAPTKARVKARDW